MIRRKVEDQLADSHQPARAKVPFVTGRLAFLALVVVAVIGIFAARIYMLTIESGEYFYEMSEENFLREAPIMAPRGKVLAADGTPIALNRTLYQLEMSRYRLEDRKIDETVYKLSMLTERPDLMGRAEDVKGIWPSWKTVALARNLDSTEVAPVLERQFLLPGVQVQTDYTRYYPLGSKLAHVSGFVGAISPKMLDAYLERGYLRQDYVGKLGVERRFEDYLRGRHGTELTILDAQGRLRSRFVQEAAQRGSDVYLNIDLRFQLLADRLLEGHSGVAVMMDPRDGRVLALASKADFDPNHPTRGIASGEASSYNKATRGLYAPGSTFKMITAAAGLRAGYDAREKINCPGRFYLPNVRRPFYCDVRWGHGPLNLYEAIQKSCNVFFYTWADRLGRDRMIEGAADWGFGHSTEFDLNPPGRESNGHLAQVGVDTIYQGSVVQMGIGQGALISTTPMQLIRAYCALANGGKLMQPQVLKEIRSPSGELVEASEPIVVDEVPMTETHRIQLLEGFSRVVYVQGGTGYNKGFKQEWDVAGKTGSSEVAGQELTDGLFVAFAPADDPEICVLVIIEAEGHGGSTALPLVVELISEYLEPGSGGDPELREKPPLPRNRQSKLPEQIARAD